MPGLTEAWRGHIDDHVIALQWSPDGQRLAAASVSGPVLIFEGGTGAVESRLQGHGFGTTDLSWNFRDHSLATSGQDGCAMVWAGGSEKFRVEGGSPWVEHVAWSPSGKLLATAAGKTLRVWDDEGNRIAEDRVVQSTIAAIAWQPGADVLAFASYGRLEVWDVREDRIVRAFDWKGSMLAMAWSPDGRKIATGDQDATAHFWDVESGQDLMMWGYQTKVRELSWDASGRYLATGGGPRVTIWDNAGSGPEGSDPIILADRQPAGISAVAFAPDSPILASGDQSGRVRLWAIAKHPERIAGLDLGSEITRLAWHPTGRSLAVGTTEGVVGVWHFAEF